MPHMTSTGLQHDSWPREYPMEIIACSGISQFMANGMMKNTEWTRPLWKQLPDGKPKAAADSNKRLIPYTIPLPRNVVRIWGPAPQLTCVAEAHIKGGSFPNSEQQQHLPFKPPSNHGECQLLGPSLTKISLTLTTPASYSECSSFIVPLTPHPVHSHPVHSHPGHPHPGHQLPPRPLVALPSLEVAFPYNVDLALEAEKFASETKDEADESAANETVASEANDSDASETVSPKDSVPRLVFVFYPKIATAPPSTLLSRPSFLDATDRKAEQEAANQIK
ncbi:hypothetical protein V8E54_008407 [Elaphomyces granulatus]